jgi:hypothetical protein
MPCALVLSESRKMLKFVVGYSVEIFRAFLDHIDRHPSRLLFSNGAILAMAFADWLLEIKSLLTIILLVLSCLVSGTTLYRKWFGKHRGNRD